MDFVFPAPPIPSVAVLDSTARFPVHRIYCIGRNYADHAKEMGGVADRGSPMFFCKPNDAIVPDGSFIPYPSATKDFHHEVELVVALQSGGINIVKADALRHVYGYAVGIDLTRRDLQAASKSKGWPWDTAKAFDKSAPISAIRPASKSGHPLRGTLTLEVNDTVRQQGDISDMLFGVPQIIHELSKLFELKAGDLIFTGTPAGVAPLKSGDRFRARMENIGELKGAIV
ncbi:MAG: fumarylacetoacetate hydrolase family protein [Rudaea sp.]